MARLVAAMEAVEEAMNLSVRGGGCTDAREEAAIR
jgi:hypothetical protein